MRLLGGLSIAMLCATPALIASSDRSVTVAARANIDERTSLAVSSSVLQFAVVPGTTSATAAVEFAAGVRTSPGREVIVVAEAARAFERPLHFRGEGEGSVSGVLAPGAPVVIARYVGGGKRQGRLVFTLDGAAPGIYAVPVRLYITVL